MQNRTAKNSGLTLIEVLVAMSIFLIVIAIALDVFIDGSNSQKRILEFNATQREAGYLMETISRELRMATAINVSQENNNDSNIIFINYDEYMIEYCKSNLAGACDAGGRHFSREGENINSSNIEMEKLIFYVTDNFTRTQPVITIAMKVKSTGQFGAEFILQNSVSLRLY